MVDLKAIFLFNKRERAGIILVTGMSLLLCVLKADLISIPNQKTSTNLIAGIQFEEALNLKEERDSIVLRNFDPNKVEEKDLESFGLDRYAVASWMGFLDKGYSFRRKEDVKKIYGLKEEDYLRLETFIQIEKSKNGFNKKSSADKYTGQKKFKTKKPNIVVDINKATEEEFMQLRGIGVKRAKTIVKFRKALGGFHSVEQIAEVYSIDSSLFVKLKPFLKVDASHFKRWNIFELSADSLQKNKFINYRAAHAIKRYLRNNKGIASVDPETLRNLDGVDTMYIDKALPYLVLRKYK